MRHNLLHALYNRAVNVREVSHLRVVGNVVHTVIGHSVMLQTGTEVKCSITGNLVLDTREAIAGLNSELTPASYYISNLDNVVADNSAAGGIGYGFWVSPETDGVRGLYGAVHCPHGEQAAPGAFANNVAHSNWMGGVYLASRHVTNPWSAVFDGSIAAKAEPCVEAGPKNPYLSNVFSNITAWKNKEFGIRVRYGVAQLVLDRPAVLENSPYGIELGTRLLGRWGTNVIYNAIFVGSEIGAREGVHFGLRTAQWHRMTVDGGHFENFDTCGALQRGSVPLSVNGFCSAAVTGFRILAAFVGGCAGSGGWETRFKRVTWAENAEMRVMWRWPQEGVLYDIDGTFSGTGQPGTSVTPINGLISNDHVFPQCVSGGASYGVPKQNPQRQPSIVGMLCSACASRASLSTCRRRAGTSRASRHRFSSRTARRSVTRPARAAASGRRTTSATTGTRRTAAAASSTATCRLTVTAWATSASGRHAREEGGRRVLRAAVAAVYNVPEIGDVWDDFLVEFDMSAADQAPYTFPISVVGGGEPFSYGDGIYGKWAVDASGQKDFKRVVVTVMKTNLNGTISTIIVPGVFSDDGGTITWENDAPQKGFGVWVRCSDDPSKCTGAIRYAHNTPPMPTMTIKCPGIKRWPEPAQGYHFLAPVGKLYDIKFDSPDKPLEVAPQLEKGMAFTVGELGKDEWFGWRTKSEFDATLYTGFDVKVALDETPHVLHSENPGRTPRKNAKAVKFLHPFDGPRFYSSAASYLWEEWDAEIRCTANNPSCLKLGWWADSERTDRFQTVSGQSRTTRVCRGCAPIGWVNPVTGEPLSPEPSPPPMPPNAPTEGAFLDEWMVIDTGAPQSILGVVMDRAQEQEPLFHGEYCSKTADEDLPFNRAPAVGVAAFLWQNDLEKSPLTRDGCWDMCYHYPGTPARPSKNRLCRYFVTMPSGRCQLYTACPAKRRIAADPYDEAACSATGCPAGYPGDQYCDPECNNAACNFDGGDCGGAQAKQSSWDPPLMAAEKTADAVAKAAIYPIFPPSHAGCVHSFNVSVSDTYPTTRWHPVDGGREYHSDCAASSSSRRRRTRGT